MSPVRLRSRAPALHPTRKPRVQTHPLSVSALAQQRSCAHGRAVIPAASSRRRARPDGLRVAKRPCAPLIRVARALALYRRHVAHFGGRGTNRAHLGAAAPGGRSGSFGRPSSWRASARRPVCLRFGAVPYSADALCSVAGSPPAGLRAPSEAGGCPQRARSRRGCPAPLFFRPPASLSAFQAAAQPPLVSFIRTRFIRSRSGQISSRVHLRW